MAGQRGPIGRHSYDRWVGEVAGRQHGVIAWWQIRDAGIPRAFVDTRLARGRLHIVHRGVYAVGHPVLSIKGRWMAAVLAGGHTAVLSHRTAAALWNLLGTTESAWIHVTVPGRSGVRRRDRVIVHRPALAPDVTVHDGIPVTGVVQTLLDLAATVDRHTVEQAADAAARQALVGPGTVVPAGCNGARLLREILAVHEPAPTRSELERRFLVLCREHGLPRPEVNAWVAGVEVDFLWPELRIVVETDGSWHDAPGRRGRDHVKDAALTLAGLRVLRFTWRQIVEDPDTVVAVLRAVLQRVAAS